MLNNSNSKWGTLFRGWRSIPQIVIVNSSTLKAVTEIPENYLGKIHKGMPLILSSLMLTLNLKCHLINESDNWA